MKQGRLERRSSPKRRSNQDRKPWRRPPRKPLPRGVVKARTKAYKAEAAALAPSVLHRADGWCEIRSPVCRGPASRRHPHHRRRQSQGGLNTPGNLVACCWECNTWAEHAEAEARQRGVIVGYGDDPDSTPMWTPGRGWWQPCL